MVVPTEINENAGEELHLQLRNTFLENLNKNGNYDDYEDADIERIRTDDIYCKRFIVHKKGNLQNALEMVNESLRWRKSFGAKDVNQASIPAEFFEAKAVYPYNKDKEGNPIIMILVRHHKRAPEFAKEIRKFVIYWVELMEAQTNGGHMSVIMSCLGAGISNLDLDLIKFLITLFRSYYPDNLAHILIYEMPWILNPAWKIIKAWLPEDFVDKIRFVNKTSIQDFVPIDSLPVDMGGTCTDEYKPPVLVDNVNNTVENVENGTDQRRATNENGLIPSQVLITDDYTIIGGILKISPATQLKFLPQTEKPNEAVIQLTNVVDRHISYKVKTNNIESYRVKPSLGIMEPGKTVEITVVLISGYRPQPTDKFLIMAMALPTTATPLSNLNSLWKNASPDTISDHKLKCIHNPKKEHEFVDEFAASPSEMAKCMRDINNILSVLEKKAEILERRQSSMQIRQTISLVLLFILTIAFLSHLTMSLDSPVSVFAEMIFGGKPAIVPRSTP